MIKKIFILMLTFCFLTTSSYSKVEDINGSKVRVKIIKKIENNVEYIQFRFCEKFKGEEDCSQILGNRDFYSVDELKSQRTKEIIQSVGTVAADISLVVIGAIATAYSAMYLTTAFFGDMALSLLGGSLGTSTTLKVAEGLAISGLFAAPAMGGMAFYLSGKVRAFNPFKQHRDQRSLRPKVLNDEDIETSDENVRKIAESLDIVLQKI